VGIHVAGGAEHGAFAGEACGTEQRQQSFWGKIPRGFSYPVEDGKPRSDRLDAGMECRPIHVLVGSAVVAVHEAGLGCQFHFLQKRLADKRAHLIRLIFAAFQISPSLDGLKVLKARGSHE
jgi:hypothetical protein